MNNILKDWLLQYLSAESVFNLLLLILFCTELYKENWKKFYRTKGACIRNFILVLLALNVCTFVLKDFTSGWTAVIFVGVLLYTAGSIYSRSHVFPLMYWYLKKMDQTLREGSLIENERFFQKEKPKFYFLLTEHERWRYGKTRYRYYSGLNPGKAYGILKAAGSYLRLEQEKEDWNFVMAACLTKLGALKAAREQLKKVKNQETEQVQTLLFLMAEQEGNQEEAFLRAERAQALSAGKTDPEILAQVYNNYGRFRRLQGNEKDALTYYKRAAAEAERSGRAELIHIIYPNLIETLALTDAGETEIGQYLEKYRSSLCMDFAANQMQVDNLELTVLRQSQKKELRMKRMYEQYESIRVKLWGSKKCIYTSQMLRMVFHEKGNPEKILQDLYLQKALYYKQLEPYERYRIMKEIAYVFQSMNPFRYYAWKKEIREYMENQAFLDLQTAYEALDPLEIHQRCHLLKEQAAVMAAYRKPYDFVGVMKYLVEARDILKVNQLVLEMTDLNISIIDEMLREENMTAAPEGFCVPFHTRHIEQLRRYLQEMEELYDKIPAHPLLWEEAVMMAKGYLHLGEMDKVKEYLAVFERSGLTMEHYADWVRGSYWGLKGIVGRVEKERPCNSDL